MGVGFGPDPNKSVMLRSFVGMVALTWTTIRAWPDGTVKTCFGVAQGKVFGSYVPENGCGTEVSGAAFVWGWAPRPARMFEDANTSRKRLIIKKGVATMTRAVIEDEACFFMADFVLPSYAAPDALDARG